VPKLTSQNGLGTLCVHAGEQAASTVTSQPLTTPILQTSVFKGSLETWKRNAAGETGAYMYTRYANPTTRAAEEKIAALEGAADCLVTASGQAATLSAILGTCQAGDEIVAMLDLYGGTLKLFSEVLERFGVCIRLVPFAEIERIEEYFSAKTRLVVLESPTNPTLRCVDIAAIAVKAHGANALVLVDNTFATPVLQRPLALGADLVMHSGTKYLGGHSDLTAGALCGSKPLIDACRRMNVHAGGTPDPQASYLLIRGLKTLELRMERACQNASQLAHALAANPAVKRVFYPGVTGECPQAMVRRQMSDFGAMLSIELADGAAAERFLSRLQLWTLAASLGGVESTVSYPVLTSHVGLEPQWEALGITAGLVRLSVGIEAYDDLLADLEQALNEGSKNE
jgi:cystathionine beta-lyase/cystathionine gamma-synthase